MIVKPCLLLFSHFLIIAGLDEQAPLPGREGKEVMDGQSLGSQSPGAPAMLLLFCHELCQHISLAVEGHSGKAPYWRYSPITLAATPMSWMPVCDLSSTGHEQENRAGGPHVKVKHRAVCSSFQLCTELNADFRGEEMKWEGRRDTKTQLCSFLWVFHPLFIRPGGVNLGPGIIRIDNCLVKDWHVCVSLREWFVAFVSRDLVESVPSPILSLQSLSWQNWKLLWNPITLSLISWYSSVLVIFQIYIPTWVLFIPKGPLSLPRLH